MARHPRQKLDPNRKRRSDMTEEEVRRRINEIQRSYAARHPDKFKEKRRLESARRRKEDPEGVARYARKYVLRTKYGLTPSALELLREEQEGACAICRRVDRKLCVDHDHRTNEVRGLLCVQCNQAIGLFGDSKDLMVRASFYLLGLRHGLDRVKFPI